MSKRGGQFCVYTALLGGYEQLNEQPIARSSSIPFICLTDDPSLTSDTWQIRQVSPIFPGDPIRSHRTLKLRPQDHLHGYGGSLYIDNTVLLTAAPEEIFARYFGAASLCVFEHSFRSRVRDEFAVVLHCGLDDEARILEQLKHYEHAAPDVLEERPYWTGILLRDHTNAVIRSMQNIWLGHVQRYSRRDQLSVNFALRRADVRPHVLSLDNHASWFHTWPHHNNRIRTRDPLESAASVAELQRQLGELQGVLARERAERAVLSTQHAEMLASTSWRMTSPLRAVGNFAKKCSGKLRGAWREVRVSRLTSRALQASPIQDAAFAAEGFRGPIQLFTRAQCELIVAHHRSRPSTSAPQWPKDRAVHDRFFYDIATRPALLTQLRTLLGDDIVLWGASIIERESGQIHIWHTDMESARPDGRFVSVWVGLENTSQETALQLISRSHRFGKPIQQGVHERGHQRGDASDETILAWAREHDAKAELVQPAMTDGQALIFDGRLWHGSNNRTDAKRTALLLQYAAAGSTVRIPEFCQFEWPFRYTEASPPCCWSVAKLLA